MRYAELHIETQRQAPAHARSEGESFLRRAGYVKSDGELTALGELLAARLGELCRAHPAAEVFGLLSLPVLSTESHADYYTLDAGRSEMLRCEACGYAERRELARFRKDVPAEEPAEPLERVATPDCHTIDSLARYLDIPTAKTAKALMYTRTGDGKFVFVVVRGDMQLSEEKLAKQVGQVRPATVEEITAAGATPGYASPIGLRDVLVVVDDLVVRSPNLVAGANEAGYHLLNTNYGRDYQPEIAVDLVRAEPGAACPHCGHRLALLSAELLHDAGGWCMPSLLEALAESHHDEKGLSLPGMAAPFDVYLLNVPSKTMDTRAPAAQLYESWQAAGVRVLFDDRDDRAGVKFADADLIGCPVRATVGERGLKDGMVELKRRTGGDSSPAPFAEALHVIQDLNKAP